MSLPSKDEGREALNENLTMRIAAMALQGVNEYNIFLALKDEGVTRYRVRKIRNSEEFKSLVREEGEKAMELARESFRSKLNNLEPLAYAALKKNLEDNKMEAVSVYLKTVGVLDTKKTDDKDSGDTSITVVMPGATIPEKEVPNTIEVNTDDSN